MRNEIHDGEALPRGYGVAYCDYQRNVKIAYPIPLNWAVGFARRVHFVLMRGPKDRLSEWAFEQAWKAWNKGWSDGYDSGYAQATADVLKIAQDRLAKWRGK